MNAIVSWKCPGECSSLGTMLLLEQFLQAGSLLAFNKSVQPHGRMLKLVPEGRIE